MGLDDGRNELTSEFLERQQVAAHSFRSSDFQADGHDARMCRHFAGATECS